mmetsp:Transcript_125170/g.279713  ORF Transcript_125170/g.279713 Transcript_125170/m.279713 type:complete len:202 (+) Transcript_125170:674-1279(+)
MSHVVGHTLDLVDHNLHQTVVAREEVHVCDAKDGLLRDVGEGALGIRLHRMGRPHVEANEIVDHLEGIEHDIPGDGDLALASHPRNHFHAAQIPLAAHDHDLLARVLDKSAHILDRERPMPVQDDILAGSHCVVDLAVGAVLDVAPEGILAGEIDFPACAKVPGPRNHRARHMDLACVVGVRRHRLQGILSEGIQHLHLLH